MRWMFHERMLSNSPYVTRPTGAASVGGEGARVPELAIARRAGRLDDPIARSLIGEAHMLALARRELNRRVSDGVASGAMSDQAAAISRLGHGGGRRTAHDHRVRAGGERGRRLVATTTTSSSGSGATS